MTRYFYFDYETKITKDLRLSKMTTRSYCEATEVTMLAWAVDDEEVKFHVGTPDEGLLEYLREMAEADDVVWVAFNISFDARVSRYTLGLPYPKRMLCAMELSRAAWPNQPGGYSLDNLSATLGLVYRKLRIDLYTAGGDELAAYCRGDVLILRELFTKIRTLVSAPELRVCEMSNRSKRLYFEVDQQQVMQAVENMANAAGAAAMDVAAAFDNDPEILKAFGWHGDEPPETMDQALKMSPKSVKPHIIKQILLDRLAIDFTGKSISMKKINQAELAAMPTAGKTAITQASAANKALSYGRGLRKFSGVATVDCELSYAAAHTLRFASRNDGCKGLNLHNCLGSDTLILTDEGWLPIIDVKDHMSVWVGDRFKTHGGLRHEGKRKCLKTLNLAVTAEHPIWTGSRMVAVGSSTPFQRALSLVVGSSSILRAVLQNSWGLNVPGVAFELPSGLETSFTQMGAGDAEIVEARRYIASYLRILCGTSTDADTRTCSTGSGPAGTEISSLSETWLSSLGWTMLRSSVTAKHLMAGLTQILKWIGLTRHSPMDQGISDSSLQSAILGIAGTLSSSTEFHWSKLQELGESLTSLRTTSIEQDVYDILDCGKFQTTTALVSNCPKHNPVIAMPFRKSFRLPEGHIWVRGDFANVEYRVEGLIAGSEYIQNLFTNDLFADPYVAFGEWATGLKIDKNTTAGKALRQLFKAAVLGLGYLMGIRTWMTQLLQVVARGDASIEDFIKLAAERGWRRLSRWARSSVTALGCHEIIGIVGEHVHELFHQRHPEFARLGRWLEAAVSRLSYAHDPASALSALYELPGAPRRELLDLFVDRTLGGSSVRARYPQWPASVCWRDLAVRETLRGACLTSVLAGHKPPRPFTPNIAIENFVQHFSRNALVKGQLELEELGHEYQISIHDEAFILAEDNPEAILKARTDMLKVFGPGNSLGYGWAINVDPASITVSRSLWDDENWCQKQFWPRLMAGDESVILEVA